MTETAVALLRAVNVGGFARVKMERLRDVFARLGFEEVRTVLQSGNVVFQAPRIPTRQLEDRLQGAVAEQLHLRTDFFVRTRREWTAVLANNPFREEAAKDPSRLTVTFLKTAPPPVAWRALRSAVDGPERVAGHGREAYIVYPNGLGRSRLTAVRIERALGTTATTRNWNTASRLAAVLAE